METHPWGKAGPSGGGTYPYESYSGLEGSLRKVKMVKTMSEDQSHRTPSLTEFFEFCRWGNANVA